MTLRKLRPASFLRSSVLHCPVLIKAAKSVGQVDISSNPSGVLQKQNQQVVDITFLPICILTKN